MFLSAYHPQRDVLEQVHSAVCGVGVLSVYIVVGLPKYTAYARILLCFVSHCMRRRFSFIGRLVRQ